MQLSCRSTDANGVGFRRPSGWCTPLVQWGKPGMVEKRLPSGVEMLEVDVLTGQGLLDDNLVSYVLEVARSGKLLMSMAGPPLADSFGV